jgi:DNA-binding PadR family transcriptional regulator
MPPTTPLTPAVFHILLALAGGQRHGYAILKEVARQTDGQVRMGPGTLYGTLQRMMEQDLVEEAPGPARPVDERRRYYQLSRSGRLALKAEVERMETLVRAARDRRVITKPSRG